MFYEEKADYLRLLPSVLGRVLEFRELAKSSDIQIDRLNSSIKNGVNNKSIAFSNEQGVLRWEKILAVSSPLNSTLQSRKNALKAKLMTKPPINMTTLRNVVETFIGVPVDIEMWWSEHERSWGRVRVDFLNWGEAAAHRWGDYYTNREPYVIYIYYMGTEDIPDLTPLYNQIYEMIPANLVVHINYRYASWSEVQAKYLIWSNPTAKTWNKLRLGVD